MVVSRVGTELYEKFFQELHAQAMGPGSFGTGCVSDGARADADESRHALFHRSISGDAAARVHPHVREHALAREHLGHVERAITKTSKIRFRIKQMIYTGPDR